MPYKFTKIKDGTKYDKKAVQIIVNSGLFNEEVSTKIIDGLFKEDIHAFNHAPAWCEKYLIGIARMLINYCNDDKNKAQSFLEQCPNEFEKYITYIKDVRPKLDEKKQQELDKKFNEEMSYEDVVKFNEERYNELNKESKNELKNMSFNSTSNFELIPIESYNQLNSMFGGNATGNGSSDKYAEAGGTAWCHTNSEGTYNQYTNNGKNIFFVLANKNWKNIKFNEESNAENPKDEYGNSLIAIVVRKRTGDIEYVTLRCNHVGVNTNADNQYQTYAELSKVARFNVEDEIMKYLKDKNYLKETNADIWQFFDGSAESLEDICYELDINREDLTNITIPNSVTIIGEEAFSECRDLTSITIPNSVKSIGYAAFRDCSSLTSIAIPNSVKSIGYAAFCVCSSLTSITIPDSVTYIGEYAFYNCSSLTSITIPNSVTSIGYGAFYKCSNLTVKTNNQYVIDYCKKNNIKYETSIQDSKKYTFTKINDDLEAIKKLYPKFDNEKFNELIELDPTYNKGSNNAGKYGKWILNIYNKGNLKEEDFYKVPNLLKEFEEKRKNISNKDINAYKDLPSLFSMLQNIEYPDQSKNQLRKKISRVDLNEEAEHFADFGDYEVWIPKTYEASCKLGKGSNWCTASRGQDYYYKSYSSKGPLYIFINKSTKEAEYQFHFETSSFMDKNDRSVDLYYFVNDICPESKKFILDNCNFEGYDFNKPFDLSELVYYYNEENKNRRELSNDFIKACFGGYIDEYFDYYESDEDLDALENYYLSKENEELLEKMHLKLENIDEVFGFAYEARRSGSEAECYNDFNSALEEVCDYLGLEMINNDQCKLTKEQYLSLYHQYDEEIGSYYEDDFLDVEKVVGSLLAKYFNFTQPYYGWNEFDEEYFNEQIKETINWCIKNKKIDGLKFNNEKEEKRFLDLCRKVNGNGI